MSTSGAWPWPGCGRAFNPLLEVLPTLGLVGILCVGGREVIDGQPLVAALITFNFYILQLVFPLRMTSFMVAQISRAAASATPRVRDPRDRAGDRRAKATRDRCPTAPGELRFEGVTFGYRAGAPVLARSRSRGRGRASRSRSWAPPESGKSTVARLVPRFYDVDPGRVLLDGVDVRDLASDGAP